MVSFFFPFPAPLPSFQLVPAANVLTKILRRYLVYIGVTPAARGRRYARQLIEHVTKKVIYCLDFLGACLRRGLLTYAQCDEEGGAPCYLESSHFKNVPMYERYGFEKKCQIHMGPTTAKPVPLDIMVRPKKTGRRASVGGRRLGTS
jgi:GNAT superfamily N-acetyltransferase